jgi:hypothetical protein
LPPVKIAQIAHLQSGCIASRYTLSPFWAQGFDFFASRARGPRAKVLWRDETNRGRWKANASLPTRHVPLYQEHCEEDNSKLQNILPKIRPHRVVREGRLQKFKPNLKRDNLVLCRAPNRLSKCHDQKTAAERTRKRGRWAASTNATAECPFIHLMPDGYLNWHMTAI